MKTVAMLSAFLFAACAGAQDWQPVAQARNLTNSKWQSFTNGNDRAVAMVAAVIVYTNGCRLARVELREAQRAAERAYDARVKLARKALDQAAKAQANSAQVKRRAWLVALLDLRRKAAGYERACKAAGVEPQGQPARQWLDCGPYAREVQRAAAVAGKGAQ